MIDKFTFRKLENGYTVRYHVPITVDMVGKGPSGFTGELFVPDHAAVVAIVTTLIDRWLETDPPPRKDEPAIAGGVRP